MFELTTEQDIFPINFFSLPFVFRHDPAEDPIILLQSLLFLVQFDGLCLQNLKLSLDFLYVVFFMAECLNFLYFLLHFLESPFLVLNLLHLVYKLVVAVLSQLLALVRADSYRAAHCL